MRGKRPTVAQRRIIDRLCRLPSGDWLVQKDTPTLLQIIHRHTDKVRTYEKRADGQLVLVNVKGGGFT